MPESLKSTYIKILTCLGLLLLAPLAEASFGITCSSTDKALQINIYAYEDIGLFVIFDHIEISYLQKPLVLGSVTWLELQESGMSLTSYSLSGRRVKIHSSKMHSDDAAERFKVESGFIEIDGKNLDITGIALECHFG